VVRSPQLMRSCCHPCLHRVSGSASQRGNAMPGKRGRRVRAPRLDPSENGGGLIDVFATRAAAAGGCVRCDLTRYCC
jgi:hypothetical protein